MTARGLRNNNPLNLRPGAKPWLGELQPPDDGYCRFIDPEHGLRAACKLLLTYQSKYGLKTIREIIHRWAPPSDNNPTDAYVAYVAGICGTDADAPIDLNDASVLSSMLLGMVQQEEGVQPYSITVLERAASQAVGDGLEW